MQRIGPIYGRGRIEEMRKRKTRKLPTYEEFLKMLIEHYGEDMQMTIAIEEMSELQKEICKNKRGKDNTNHLAEEIADVLFCMDQLQVMFGVQELVGEWKEKKVRRTYNRCFGDAEGEEEC